MVCLFYMMPLVGAEGIGEALAKELLGDTYDPAFILHECSFHSLFLVGVLGFEPRTNRL